MPALARYGLAVLLVLGALYGAYRHGVTTERARGALAAETERSEAARLIIAEQQRATDEAAALDARYTEDLQNAHKRIKDLERGSPGAEPVRVYVKAACPAVPEAGTPAGVGGRSQQVAELDGVARSDYFDLLREIATKEKALAYCVEASRKR